MTNSRNPNDQPFTSDEIETFLETGREADFLLELEVLKLLNDNNYRVSFCGRYDDPVSKKTREFDVRAHQIGKRKQMVMIAAECKNISVNSPILALCSTRIAREANIEVIERTQQPLNSSSILSPFRIKKELWQEYVDNKYDCRTIVQIKGDKRGTTNAKYSAVGNQQSGLHTKWEQATASLGDFLNQVAANQYPEAEEYYFFPFLVVPDNTLWAAFYDEHGTRVAGPQLVDVVFQHISMRCDFNSQPTPQSFCIEKMHIATLTGFNEFLNDVGIKFDLDFPFPKF